MVSHPARKQRLLEIADIPRLCGLYLYRSESTSALGEGGDGKSRDMEDQSAVYVAIKRSARQFERCNQRRTGEVCCGIHGGEYEVTPSVNAPLSAASLSAERRTISRLTRTAYLL